MQSLMEHYLTKVVSLNPSSVWLWEQLSGTEFDAGRVADLLTEHYEVERPTALADAETWIAQLRKAELIEE